jgi:YVTN family beta-propeller protein
MRPGGISLAAGLALVLTLAGLSARFERPIGRARTPASKGPGVAPAGEGMGLGRVVKDGLAIEARLVPLGTSSPGEVREGSDVRFEFSVVDSSGKTPVTKLYPSSWIVARPDGAPPASPKDAARIAASMIRGSIFNPPDLDLNVYYLVSLNHDATLSVVDPRFGFGGTRLLALVPLESRGDDWALGPGGRRLFVAMPEVNKVAVVDTVSWKVVANLPGGVRPDRLALSPDGRRLWVAGGATGRDDSGVTVFDSEVYTILTRIKTGRGHHDLTFSPHGEFALVSNSGEGTVSILDAEAFREEAVVKTGRRPYSLDFSSKAGLAYVTDDLDGTITAIDPSSRKAVARIAARPGVWQIRFDPEGRAGFVVNPEANTVEVIDPATNTIIQTVKVEAGPDQVAFSREFAYIRHRGSPTVAMVALRTAGKPGAPLSLVTFPAGSHPPASIDAPSPAGAIVPAPGASAMLVANARDRSLYYYKEGLSAPMGTFNNYKREPRAVLVIDRSLGERSRPGLYESTVRLDRPGSFDVVFYLDQPRIVHSFPLSVAPDPVLAKARERARVDVRSLVADPRALAGELFRPMFQLETGERRGPKSDLKDVLILMYCTGGSWQDRQLAREIAPGIYGADFRPDRPGVYNICVACDSIGLSVDNPHPLIVHVESPAPSAPRSQPR